MNAPQCYVVRILPVVLLGSVILSSGIKRTGREIDPFLPSGAEMNYAGCYSSTPSDVYKAQCSITHHGKLMSACTLKGYRKSPTIVRRHLNNKK